MCALRYDVGTLASQRECARARVEVEATRDVECLPEDVHQRPNFAIKIDRVKFVDPFSLPFDAAPSRYCRVRHPAFPGGGT